VSGKRRKDAHGWWVETSDAADVHDVPATFAARAGANHAGVQDSVSSIYGAVDVRVQNGILRTRQSTNSEHELEKDKRSPQSSVRGRASESQALARPARARSGLSRADHDATHIVDQNVDPAPPLVHFLHHLLDGVRVAHVQRERERRIGRRVLERPPHVVKPVRRPRGQGDAQAALREEPSERGANAGRCTGLYRAGRQPRARRL
jgi:hypothetical protein